MKKRTVLCVDDDPDDREIIRELLQTENPGWNFIEASDGREALYYLRSQTGRQSPPDLILLDLNMPVLNGRETLAILKSERDIASIPVVVFTTSNFESDAAFCQQFNVEMITKPLTIEENEELIRKIVASYY